MTPGLLIAIIAAAHLDPGDVVWLRKPTGNRFRDTSLRTSVISLDWVILHCAVTTSGQLSDCSSPRLRGPDALHLHQIRALLSGGAAREVRSSGRWASRHHPISF